MQFGWTDTLAENWLKHTNVLHKSLKQGFCYCGSCWSGCKENIYLIYDGITTFIDKLILRAQRDELERDVSEKENKFV